MYIALTRTVIIRVFVWNNLLYLNLHHISLCTHELIMHVCIPTTLFGYPSLPFLRHVQAETKATKQPAFASLQVTRNDSAQTTTRREIAQATSR